MAAEETDVYDPAIWGPRYWFMLMTIALTYPETPNDVAKRKYYDFIQNLPLFIPNPKIGNRFSEYLDKYPVSPYLGNRESFVKWVHFIHNKINVLIGKEEISFVAAMEAYYAEYRPKPVFLTDKINIRKYWIFAIFIIICFTIIYFYY